MTALTPEQVQEVLACEYGGINESFAELYARTNDKRWLAMAELFYDKRVLGPLAAREDKLANFHANTQVPKLIGLARIHDLTGEPAQATAAPFFWDRCCHHHRYLIGGHAACESFFEPDYTAPHVPESTCDRSKK